MAMPLKPTPVFLLTPGPTRWKFCRFESSRTVIVYQRDATDLTRTGPVGRFSHVAALIVTRPLSFGGAEIPFVVPPASAAPGSAARQRIAAVIRIIGPPVRGLDSL